MRGLEEIRKTNENPHAFHGEEQFGARHRDARPDYGSAENGGRPDWDGSASHARVQNADAIDSLLYDLGLVPGKRSLAERTKEQNARKALRALDELLFGALLIDLLSSGKPKKPAAQSDTIPLGALTFIGKDWDGLRAVPAEPVKYLGGSRPAYHGEFKDGDIWRVVSSQSGPIVYAHPEDALHGAANGRRHLETHKS